jgi:L-ascorbate metabolism protein UlaG (beta-lactamase superfamily)
MKVAQILVLIGAMGLHSCISIRPSALREPDPESIQVAGCEISSTGAVHLNVFGLYKTDFMPAGVRIKASDKLIYVDPIAVEDTFKADYILVTHNHLDHFSKPDITKLSKPETVVIGPVTVSRKLKSARVKTAAVGNAFEFGVIRCEVVESYNLKAKLHKKGSKFLGFVISCDTTRIYIAGDTDWIPEMEELEEISVALIPIGEGQTAMNPESAAEAINHMKPELVIPVHYELQQGREKDFTERVKEPVKVRFFPVAEN